MIWDKFLEYIGVRTALVFSSVFFSLLLLMPRRRRRNLPPGPWPWPLVGNLPLLAKHPDDIHLTMEELTAKYGGIYSLHLGKNLMVVISNVEIAREAFLKKASVFSSRPSWTNVAQTIANGKGIIWQNGEHSRLIRKFSQLALKDFGVGKATLEERIIEEADAITQEFAKQDGKSFRVQPFLMKAVSNIICSICFGTRYEYTNEEFKHLLQMLFFSLNNIGFIELSDHFPILRLFGQSKELKQTFKYYEEMDEFIDAHIERHRATFDPDNIRDFVDIYLEKEMEGHDDDTAFSRENMRAIIADLFGTGTDTTSTTLDWTLLYMIRYPDIQKKCREQVLQVCGTGRIPSYQEKHKLPYIEATLLEVLRLSSIVPTNGPHEAREDATLAGYNIPKRTIILCDMIRIHRDAKHWGDDPGEFNPSPGLARTAASSGRNHLCHLE